MNAREQFAFHFREIHPKFSRFYVHILEDVNLTLPQYALLNQLTLQGAISMTEASGRLQITKPAVTNLVDRLEEKKFLKRLPHPKDRRIILLSILPKGESLIAKVQAASLELLLKAYDRFNDAEHKIISRFYATLSETMDELAGKSKNEK